MINNRVSKNTQYRGRRAIGLAMSMMLMGVAMVGCKKNTADVTIDVNQLAEDLVQQGSYNDQLVELDDDMFEVIYYEVEPTDIVEKEVYYNSGASSEQVVVIEAKDHEAAKEVKDSLQKALDEQIDANKDYLPDEIPKLEKPVLKTMSNYVILCVSNDNEKAEAILDKIK